MMPLRASFIALSQMPRRSGKQLNRRSSAPQTSSAINDSTLDKPYAKKIELVARHRSGKHREVVEGINLITLLWTDGDRNV